MDKDGGVAGTGKRARKEKEYTVRYMLAGVQDFQVVTEVT